MEYSKQGARVLETSPAVLETGNWDRHSTSLDSRSSVVGFDHQQVSRDLENGA